MPILDLLAKAETSSDLRHHEYFCSIDVVGAAGMAAINDPGHMALYRLKYLSDNASIALAKSTFIIWTRKAMMRRGVDPSTASRVGVQTLMKWLGDVCPTCHGLGYPLLEGTPSLSSKPCGHCKGTGRTPIRGHGDLNEAIKDVLERAEDAINSIQRAIGAKMGDRA